MSAEPNLVMEQGVVDVTSGKYEAIRKIKGCHPLWSADGRVLAYADGAGRVAVSRADGSGQRFIPGLGGGARYASFDVASLSPDGSRIALLRRGPNEDAGDVARELDVNAGLDTRTGKKVDLPLGGRNLRHAGRRSAPLRARRSGQRSRSTSSTVGATESVPSMTSATSRAGGAR
ncbi:hypothetical protein ACL02O_00100 [Micromonospora sp. MS34]|uniref:hypothetical protein n=1 Tax=Micromonospora sp. MS34 TaxID=3385971 RepID=UPI0039A06407